MADDASTGVNSITIHATGVANHTISIKTKNVNDGIIRQHGVLAGIFFLLFASNIVVISGLLFLSCIKEFFRRMIYYLLIKIMPVKFTCPISV